ncbi:MAG: Lactate utilization protein B [Phycisphaerae bacterium]|nr:Lactate utilization protein B [Phycisphaerae bacterium]
MSPRPSFAERSRAALDDAALQAALQGATTHKVAARAEAMSGLRNYERLRAAAADIKQHTLDHLDTYLEQFVARVEARGGRVHFAADRRAANEIIAGIAQRRGAKLCVKSKSMTSEETGLNAALAAAGVQVVETDLGEFIVQIDHDHPSHIVTPIIHKNRQTIARAFVRELGVPYTEDPEKLTAIARDHLRAIFRRADLGITGVNFGVAESGTICICTNEGNGRLTMSRPRVHVALMGIEKIVPRMRDLSVFLKLLARSSTGQPITVYTSLVSGPRGGGDPDGPEELHVVIMDAGRSDILAGPHRDVLRCIRCGACLNACPVYRRVGGHAYGSVYPGPIGKLLTPLFGGLSEHADLPQASSLCGLCHDVCPVKIDIPHVLVALRREQTQRRIVSRGHRWTFALVAWFLRSRALYELAQHVGGWFLRRLARDGWIIRAAGPLRGALRQRDLRAPAEQSFRELWRSTLRRELSQRAAESGRQAEADQRG